MLVLKYCLILSFKLCRCLYTVVYFVYLKLRNFVVRKR